MHIMANESLKENSNGHWEINGLTFQFLYTDINNAC